MQEEDILKLYPENFDILLKKLLFSNFESMQEIENELK